MRDARSTMMSKLIRYFLIGLHAMLFSVCAAAAGNTDAGKTKVTQLCAECHRPGDWSGETQPALQSLIKHIVAGKVPHSKRTLNLTDQDIADIAAYWTSG